MENYVRALLYIYPKLKKTEVDYGEHIKNKAFLSYGVRKDTFSLAESIATEIIKRDLVKDLNKKMTKFWRNLKEKDKALLEIKYFRRKRFLEYYKSLDIMKKIGCDRNYFRLQSVLLERSERLLDGVGITKEKFFNDYICIDEVNAVFKYVDKRSEVCSVSESAVLRYMRDKKENHTSSVS